MNKYKEYNMGTGGQNPLGSFFPLLIMVLVLFLLFYVVKGLFTILSFVAPVLLIITLVLDHKVILDYFRFIGKVLKDNVLMGILAVLLTIIGWHVVTGFLFFKAITKRGLKKAIQRMEEQEQGQYVEYEEVEEESENFLELPEQPVAEQRTNQQNDYDDLFK